MSYDDAVLAQIQKLKALFDTSSKELRSDYWTEELLQIYSETLGERIRWKWDHVLKNLKEKKIHPEFFFKSLEIVDWGCGPGTASLSFLESCDNPGQHSFRFEDRSKVAVNFAEKRIQRLIGNNVQKKDKAPSLLLISYVLSELGKAEEKVLLEKIFKADSFLWIDAGTHKESRRLTELRNTLLPNFDFHFPCPHSHACPLSGPSHPNDWCHHFAKAPAEVFHSAKWAELSKELRIDLRSLPFTALYAIKKAFNLKPLPKEAIRLGRPRVGKHEITVDHCTLNGTYENTKISKRENPELFKKLKKE